jgi:glycosyltransferase involved in cell wall biosynthesis
MTRDSCNSHEDLPIVAIYGLDLDVKNTTSLGIMNHTRRLISALAECAPPGFHVMLLVSQRNAQDVVPPVLPPWITAHVVQCHGSGILTRFWTDQVLSGYYARKVRASVIHFPKGFIPVWGMSGRRVVATIHDTIVFYYHRHFPGWFPRGKIRYFCWMTILALKRAERVLTVSGFSRDALVRLCPAAAGKIEVLCVGAGVAAAPHALSCERHGLMVLGSILPHKAIAQTLRLLNEYAVYKGISGLEVVVTGLSRWPGEWGVAPDRLALSLKGRVSDAELTALYGESRALVLLSEIEGMGLPVIESYSMETPVCYRASTSLAEVLEGVPGGWDGVRSEGFFKALDEALSMSPAEVGAIRLRLSGRYDWCRAAQRVLAVYAEELRKGVRRDFNP